MYEQLYRLMRTDIIRGKLMSGDRLPSKRSLAGHLGVSITTVENAYAQLAAEGYVLPVARKGFYVAQAGFPKCEGAMAPSPAPDKGDLEAIKRPAVRVDFIGNDVPKALFPCAVWMKLLRRGIRMPGDGFLEDSPGTGLLALRQRIAEHLWNFRGMQVSADRIIIGSGAEHLYGLIVQLLGREKRYGVENPGYVKIARAYAANGAATAPIPMCADGIDIGALRDKRADVAHVCPSHHFPTGVVMPIQKRYALLEWAGESASRCIVEDEYDSEFRLSGRPIPPLQSIDREGKVIYLNTFTKTVSRAIRISYMVLPEWLMARYLDQLDFYACPVPSLMQQALAEFIGGGYFERHINRMRTYYRRKRDLLIHAVRTSALEPIAEIDAADGGLHFLLRLNIACSDVAFKSALAQRGIRISALSDYYHEAAPRSTHCFLINYSAPSEAQIRLAVAEMAEVAVSMADDRRLRKRVT